MVNERRQHPRAPKNFILRYYEEGHKDKAEEVTQLKNISTGGVCFVTQKAIQPGTVLWLELNTPYLTETAYLEGEVLASHEKAKDMLYETRLKFENLNDEAKFILQKLMEYFENEKKGGDSL